MENDQKIIDLYKSGLSIRKISKKTSVSFSQIRRILIRNNIIARSNKIDNDTEKDIIEKYQNGISSEKIAEEYGFNSSTVCRVLKRNNVEIKGAKHFNRKYEINENYLEIIDTEDKAYFLGFMYADGHVYKRKSGFSLTLHNKDFDILKTFGNLLYKNPTDSNFDICDKYTAFGVCSVKMTNDLISHGCVPAKTFKITMPEINEKLMHHFLRGFYDGDGCIRVADSRVRLILTGYTGFLTEVRDHFEKMGIEGILRKIKENSVSEFTIGRKRYVEKALDYLYENSSIYLNRKYNKYLEAKKMLSVKNKPPLRYGTANIVSYNGKKLTSENISKMTPEEKDDAVDYVFKFFRESGFPYPKFNSTELMKDFEKLKLSKVKIENNRFYNLDLSGFKIFKHFCPHYFDVRGSGMISMAEAFQDDEKLLKVIRNRMGITLNGCFNITGNMIRQGFRNSRNSFAASIFKPSLAKSIYDNFAPENSSVLDISAGFGQRMLGALTSEKVVKYTAYDPWKDTIKALNNILEFVKVSKEVVLHCEGAENMKEEPESFDFCFSSPPFFDKEVYSSSETQAYNGKDFNDFVEVWWDTVALKVFESLKSRGLFVLNMDPDMAKVMIKYVDDRFELVDEYYVSYKRSHLGSGSKDMFFVLRKIK